ncbi:hypothetical protein [Dyadobacter fanqingshengii]|uniref:DUF3575 domain-containing protein n=1 Tax=Dyadobacter fanqingshengii TaxID=2906443 RepID=A0A9X1PAC8_9BACT|nr:hypothetical protein [Dyadobacter fanqingshengii]MCF0041291.1 hypothetical protein [Dyadobacter fanqingshengii]USJ36984.1 hypothetical protein NFI81_04245 [Dyadobacter fanqingshengii]
MKTIVKILLLTLGTCFNSIAQKQPSANRFELEADPIAYILNGYSFHVGYTLGHVRFDAGVFGIKQPKFALENEQFSVKSSGFGIKADYLFRANKGFFLGLQSDYGTDRMGLKNTAVRQEAESIMLGLRTGYRFMFGKKENQYKGLYLVPWVALINTLDPADIMENDQRYEQKKWSLFPTVHLGYRF